MNVPIVIIFFNRIVPLQRLVARLSEIKPAKVYLISDGPRSDRIGEEERVNACREYMANLPWNCDVIKNFSEVNLGCRERVTTGLDWVFEHEERAIILEDDCVPEQEFFPWVEKMLERYADESMVLSVGGTNLRPQLCDPKVDSVFTKYAMIWGWATWRRAWFQNDKNLTRLDEACHRHQFKKWLGKWRAEWYWRYLLSHVKSSWGYRWMFTHFINEAYCVVPPVNLVENIGMSDIEATHTSCNPYEIPDVYKGWNMDCVRKKNEMCNELLDCWIEDNFYSRSIVSRIKWVLRKIRR